MLYCVGRINESGKVEFRARNLSNFYWTTYVLDEHIIASDLKNATIYAQLTNDRFAIPYMFLNKFL